MPIADFTNLQPNPATDLAYAAHCERQIAALATIIAANSHSPADAIEWRDAFCHECDGNECLNGTARQLAEKIYAQNWIVASVKHANLNCANCQDS